MILDVTSSSTAWTRYYNAEGIEVIPRRCRCGAFHTGDYAINDYLQCECLHNHDLLDIGNDTVMCPECGKTWGFEKRWE